MLAFRSRLRLIAVAWLFCQVASLSAFVPEDCCATHTAIAAAKHAAETTPPCHEDAPTPAPEPEHGAACPMHQAEEGAACPMHRSPSGECCGMSNGCDGPNRPLANLFAFAGVLEAPAASMSAPASTAVTVDRPATLLHRLVTPDAPPPKS